MSSAHSLNLGGVLSETKRIIKSNSRHFLALSVLFLLPLSLSFIIYPLLSPPTSIPPYYHQSLFSISTPNPPIDNSPLILPILHVLFVLIFSLFATASITYGTFHGFYNRPLNFLSSVKSLLFSFLPLLVTLLVSQIILGLILFAFGGFSILLYNWILFLGVDIDYDSDYFLVLAISVAILFLVVLVYFLVEWYLTFVIVVVESQWGLAPLRRSSFLVKGMRKVAFSMFLLFGSLLGLLCVLISILVQNASEVSEGWVRYVFVFQAGVCVGLMTVVKLYSIAANAVLFIYCKALHGELALEEELERDYISLPIDEGDVPRVVCVV